jgi:hypothetical protein
MVISIISEPRSGSTNLANWFHNYKNIEILFEPLTNKQLKWFKGGTNPIDWYTDKEIFLIKETITYDEIDFNDLISISDKIILLYRENFDEQLLSYTNAKKNNSWDKSWDIKSIDKRDTNMYRDELLKIKDNFNIIKNNLYKKQNVFYTSYENLYHHYKIDELVKFLDIKIEGKFPFGNKLGINKKLF